jgi:hypothetical protein
MTAAAAHYRSFGQNIAAASYAGGFCKADVTSREINETDLYIFCLSLLLQNIAKLKAYSEIKLFL